jgi:hypothetical protein
VIVSPSSTLDGSTSSFCSSSCSRANFSIKEN